MKREQQEKARREVRSSTTKHSHYRVLPAPCIKSFELLKHAIHHVQTIAVLAPLQLSAFATNYKHTKHATTTCCTLLHTTDNDATAHTCINLRHKQRWMRR
jgi:hypothetical protein